MDSMITSSSNDDMENRYTDLVNKQHSEDMLDIKGFVKATDYDIDPLIIDEQWNMLNARRPDELIVLNEQMIKRLNFCRIPTLIKKLEQLFPIQRGENNEYWGDGINVSINLTAATDLVRSKHGGHLKKQIKMTKGAYKQLLMETQTDAARQVRKYYICLEELFVQYLLYQRAYEVMKAEKSLEIVVTENKILSSKLDIVIAQNKEQENYLQRVIVQNEGLSKQNEGLSKQNDGLSKQLQIQDRKLDTLSQILYHETNNKVVDVHNIKKQQELVVLQKKDDPETCVILRGQKAHVKNRMKRSQDEMHIVGTVESYKNPINLYNRFSEQTKKQKDGRFEVIHNKVTLKNGTTPTELLDCFNSLNEQKHEVADKVKRAL